MLTFTSEARAQAAKDAVWVNYIRQKAAEGDNLVGLADDPKTSAQVAAMADAEVKNLLIYGFRGARPQKDISGGASGWASHLKVYNQDLWFMEEPPQELMAGVENYSIQAFDPNWLDPNLNP